VVDPINFLGKSFIKKKRIKRKRKRKTKGKRYFLKMI
jgi:hypothetical protein